ncbi:hypothetical protein [Candidatus Hepatobacter penaei]|nr:hypothetical protein [Candidatus Hepatobacter penaei]
MAFFSLASPFFLLKTPLMILKELAQLLQNHGIQEKPFSLQRLNRLYTV